MTGNRCTYLRCPTPAVNRIEPKYGRPWFGCAEHTPAMAKALDAGQALTDGSRVVALEASR